MTKYNHYAKDLDAALKAARQEYMDAWDKLQKTEAYSKAAFSSDMERQKAKLKHQEAELAFKDADSRIWAEFNRKRAELRAALETEVRSGAVAVPDAVDTNGLELMKSGVLSADDYYSIAEKYEDNPTMLKLVAKYAKESADDMESTQAKERGALYHLASVCSQGQSRTMRAWDELSKIADYCSGQTRDRRDTPTHTLNMSKWWERLAGEAVEGF